MLVEPNTQLQAEGISPPTARIELHVHLEGALRAQRALDWARLATDVPPVPSEGIDGNASPPRWRYEGLGGFLRLFGWGTRLLRSAEEYRTLLADLLDSYRAQHVIRAEVFLALGQMHRAGVDARAIVRALAELARESEAEGGPSVWFLADATRQWGVKEAELALDTALALQEHRVVGFGMGGDETAVRAREFRHLYRRAAEAGLGLTCHAGEGTHPDAVREVVEELGVRRVGHGYAAARDESLLRELRDEDVVLEVCPTSNERTGVWNPADEPHPLLRFLERGVPVVLGSDDPAFFGCTLNSEFARVKEMGVSEESCESMRRTAQRVGFAPV